MNLDELFENAEATRATNTDDVTELLHHLGRNDGFAPVEALLDEGWSEAIIVAACATPDPGDRRVKPRAVPNLVGDKRIIHLTSAGYSFIGQPAKRSSPPTVSTMRHRMAPRNLAKWIGDAAQLAEQWAVTLDLVRGRGVWEISEGLKADAWGQVRIGSNTQAARLTGTGCIPDAILIERWLTPEARKWRDEMLYAHTNTPGGREAEWVVAIEVQQHTQGLIRAKVERHEAAQTLATGWQATVWAISSSRVLNALKAVGVGDPASRPGQWLVRTDDVGLGASDIKPGEIPDGSLWRWPAILTSLRQPASPS